MINVRVKDKRTHFGNTHTINDVSYDAGDGRYLDNVNWHHTPERVEVSTSFESKFLTKKKSVVNIVKIPLVAPLNDRAFRINKNLLNPVSLNSMMNKSAEKVVKEEPKFMKFGLENYSNTKSRSKSEIQRMGVKKKSVIDKIKNNFQNLNFNQSMHKIPSNSSL